MAWIMDTYSMTKGYPVPGVVTGKPISLGGSLGRNEATGRGVFYTVQCACEHLKYPGQGRESGGAGVRQRGLHRRPTAARQSGPGDRGQRFARLHLQPARARHSQADPRTRSRRATCWASPARRRSDRRNCWRWIARSWFPAALENTIDGENAHTVKATIVAEAANGPVTPEGDTILEHKGCFLIPDILCNAGGVTVSYFEWVQDEQHLFWEAEDVYTKLERVMKTSFAEVLRIHLAHKVSMRTAANMLGIGRVAEATKIRGLYP